MSDSRSDGATRPRAWSAVAVFAAVLCAMSALVPAAHAVAPLFAPLVAPGPNASPGPTAPIDPGRDEARDALLERAELGTSQDSGRTLFEAALASAAFDHLAVGPFDLYAYRADGFKKSKDGKKALKSAAEGLEPLAEVLAQRFGAERGVVSGRRFPVVLTSAKRKKDDTAFDEVVALLDHCEDGAFSGYKADLPVWSLENLDKDLVATWDVAVINVAHQAVKQEGRDWYAHGLGYRLISFLVNRLHAKGPWGPPPPWLREGLVDELDIETYGEAWVKGAESMVTSSRQAGYSRKGWSGFVPKGSSPPPPFLGNPPKLSVSFTKTVVSDSWLNRSNSKTRHWSELSGDMRSEAPVSLASMAASQEFGPRDRAYARCVLHVLLAVAPPDGPGLLEALDVESRVARSGMRDGDPLPVVVARWLGGAPEIDAIEKLSMEELLVSLDKPEIVERIKKLGGTGMLRLSDHRKQADWLYLQKLDDRSRLKLFLTIAEVEGYQELREWEILGDVVDQAMRAGLGASKSYPKKDKRRIEVTSAVRSILDELPQG